MLYLWLSGGELYLAPILSSLLVIGKCGGEEYLIGKPENLLAGKSALEKLWLTIKYIPLFSLTAFFRVGAGVIKVIAMSRCFLFRLEISEKCKKNVKSQVMGPYSTSINPLSPTFFFFVIWIWCPPQQHHHRC